MATDIRPRGSRNNQCEVCQDDAVTSCASCGKFVCKDCKIDHDCVVEDEKAKSNKPIKK